mgnify:CR=1 FL=1
MIILKNLLKETNYVSEGAERLNKNVISEASDSPTYGEESGLINYFGIPFTKEDIEELLSASKKVLGAKFTKNK